MAKLQLVTGTTSYIAQVFIQDSTSTTGSGKTGLAFNTSSLTAYYHRDTDTTATAISLATMTVGTFTSSGFKEIDATNMPGWYQLCPPNTALAAGAKTVGIHLQGATGMAPLPLEIELTAVNNQDATKFGMTRVVANSDQLAGQTITAAAGVTFPTSVASPTNITAGTITTATNLTNAPTAGDFTATMKTSIGTAVAASAVASVTAGVSVAAGGIQSTSFAVSAIDAAAIATDAIGSAELAATAVSKIAAGMFARAFTAAYGSFTFEQLVEIMSAALAGKLSGAATTTATMRNLNDSADVIVATVDANGNRSAVTLTP